MDKTEMQEAKLPRTEKAEARAMLTSELSERRVQLAFIESLKTDRRFTCEYALDIIHRDLRTIIYELNEKIRRIDDEL
jgi:hypothetical protein